MRTEGVTTTALALGTRADTNAGLGTVDDLRLASRQLRAYASAARTRALVPARRKARAALGQMLDAEPNQAFSPVFAQQDDGVAQR
jgi:hypothetical protein